jgi:Ca2+-binding EF-hand superfamily protein
MTRKSVTITIFTVFYSATLAMAWQRPIDMIFKAADTDHNNLISEAEWHTAMQKRFEAIDANHNGNISREEIEKYKENMREKFRSGNMQF